jgi:arylsulfatase A-like enzyme
LRSLFGGCLLAVFTSAASVLAADRPNVLFIMSDDHAAQAVSAYGHALAEVAPTPHIDRLAREGILFRNAFCTNSICTPSRAVIFTGKYSHRNGVYKFTALDQRQPTLPKLLRAAGHQTAFVGKWHLKSTPVGFEWWSVLPGQGRYHRPAFVEMGDEAASGRVRDGKRTSYEGHSSDVIADKALSFLRAKRDPERPFALFCHFKAPHDTWEFAERYRTLFDDVEIPEPPTLFDTYEGRPALKKTLQYIGSEWGHHTDFVEETPELQGRARKAKQYQLYMKKYLRCVRGVDDNVGRILDYLDDSGLAKETIVVYTSDQGFFLGEHGLYDKRFMYEESLRVPLLVRWPQEIPAGSTDSSIVLNLDFAPTLLSMTGHPIPTDMQGRSFEALYRGRRPDDWRTSMYYRYYFSHFETEPHYGVRTAKYKLIHFDRTGHWELYDLENDPTEVRNVYNAPTYRAIRERLTVELTRLQRELGDDCEDRGDRPRTGFDEN